MGKRVNWRLKNTDAMDTCNDFDTEGCISLCALSNIFSFNCAEGRALMDEFNDISRIFSLSRRQILDYLGPSGERFADAILKRETLLWARDEVRWARSAGIRLIGLGDGAYPWRLAECSDAPLMLYCKGPADLNAGSALAVVGTRRATYYGKDFCRKVVESLAFCQKKPLIVSGMALGIDGCAHTAALDAGLTTIGVLPCGLDEVYPHQHRGLASRILESGGALITDFARATGTLPYTFVRRNRIIAGMADATLLAESFDPGGGLITARLAHSYGRDVFAVPGRNTDKSFEGCNRLICSLTASIVTGTGTIPSAMGWAASRKRLPKQDPELFRADDTPVKSAVVSLLADRSPLSVEEIVEATELDVATLCTNLLELELSGRLVPVQGGKYGLR